MPRPDTGQGQEKCFPMVDLKTWELVSTEVSLCPSHMTVPV